jgi:LSD1 subclass zinc finger protein
MGLYPINCPACQKPHMWFSGSMDQRCTACKAPREWFIAKTGPEVEGGYDYQATEMDLSCPGNDEWTRVIEYSAYLFQCKQLEDTANTFNKASEHWQAMIADLQSQLLTEKAEVGRLLALNKRRTKS